MLAVYTAQDLGEGPLKSFADVNEQCPRGALASDKVRFVGDPVALVIARTRAQAVDARRAGRRRLRGPAGRDRRRGRRGRRCSPAVRGSRHQRRGPPPRHRPLRPVRGCRPRRAGADGQPARRRRADRGQRHPRRARPGRRPARARHRLGLHPAPPLRARPARRGPRSRQRRRPRRRAARRRGVRRQGRHRHGPRGGRPRGRPARPPRQVDRDPQRGDALDARPRPGAVRRAGPDLGGPDRGPATARARRVRGVRRLRGRAGRGPDVPDGAGRLRHPGAALRRRGRDDQHRSRRRLPWRRAARGGGLHRAVDRRRGRRAGARSGGDPAAQLHPARRLPVQDPDGRDLRHRRLRPGPDRGTAGGRHRACPAGAAAPHRRRRAPAARHRAGDVRRDHRVRRLGVRPGRGARRRHRHGAFRHLVPRPGPRDELLDDRRRPARASPWRTSPTSSPTPR